MSGEIKETEKVRYILDLLPKHAVLLNKIKEYCVETRKPLFEVLGRAIEELAKKLEVEE